MSSWNSISVSRCGRCRRGGKVALRLAIWTGWTRYKGEGCSVRFGLLARYWRTFPRLSRSTTPDIERKSMNSKWRHYSRPERRRTSLPQRRLTVRVAYIISQRPSDRCEHNSILMHYLRSILPHLNRSRTSRANRGVCKYGILTWQPLVKLTMQELRNYCPPQRFQNIRIVSDDQVSNEVLVWQHGLLAQAGSCTLPWSFVLKCLLFWFHYKITYLFLLVFDSLTNTSFIPVSKAILDGAYHIVADSVG